MGRERRLGGGFFLWRAGARKAASSVRSETTKAFRRVTNGLIFWLILLHLWTLRISRRESGTQLAAAS